MKLLSGGQSGVDRAVLDVALARGIPYGGWCPKGGWAEDFPEPPGVLAKYPQLAETPLADPAQRTEWNVRDADACLILVDVDGLAVSRGTALARDQAAHYGKPLFIAELGAAEVGDRAAAWLGAQRATFGPDLALRSAALGRAKRQASMLAPPPSSARCSTAARHLAQLAIIGERVPISIADDEARALQLGVGLLDGPGRREAARRRHGGIIGSVAAGGAERSTATSAVSSYLMQINAAVRLHGP
jgi:hypothetical protein